jgi:hypothetical protein
MYKKSKNRIYLLLFVVIAVAFYFIVGCSSVPKPPPCVNKSALNSQVRWGEIVNGKTTQNWSLQTNGLIEEWNGEITNDKSGQFVHYMNPDTLCLVLRHLGELVVEIQTLNVPAAHNYFIEYKNPERDFYFRALWDPEFDNSSNRKFDELYKRLVNLTKK